MAWVTLKHAEEEGAPVSSWDVLRDELPAYFDPAAGELRPGASLLIEDERVVEVALEGRTLRASAPDARRIDAAGRTLMPGLIDAHVHAVLTTMDLAALEPTLEFAIGAFVTRVLTKKTVHDQAIR